MNNNHDYNNERNKPYNPAAEEQFEAYYRQLEQLPPLPVKRKRKNTSFISYMSAFLAGALLIGGLTFAADRLNLFTGGIASDAIDQQNGAIPYHDSSGLTTASQKADRLSTSDVYEQASRSVVKIETYAESQQINSIDDLWQYYGSVPESKQQDNSDSAHLQLVGSGTGFIVDEAGYILTNAHVVSGANTISVSIMGYAEPLTATVVNSDAALDIAILKVDQHDGQPLPALTIADSDRLDIGNWVMAIGNPSGYDYTLTLGVISAKERPITIMNEQGKAQVIEHMLQTDASINPGNSGGPLLNEAGEVVGMNTAISSEAQGIGFAIPSNIIVEYIQATSLATTHS